MSTPAGRSSFVSASTVLGVVLVMSISLLWVLCSNCSLLSLYLWTALKIVTTSFSVGSGMGPDTSAPVFFTASMILLRTGLMTCGQRPSAWFWFFVVHSFFFLLFFCTFSLCLYKGSLCHSFQRVRGFAHYVHGSVCFPKKSTKQKAGESLRPHLVRTILHGNSLLAQ